MDLVRAFLAGKMSVDDAELVRDLVEEGLCAPPVFLPEWFIDIDRLNAIATHSVTMNRFSLPTVTRYYAARRKVASKEHHWNPTARGAGHGGASRRRGRGRGRPRGVNALVGRGSNPTRAG